VTTHGLEIVGEYLFKSPHSWDFVCNERKHCLVSKVKIFARYWNPSIFLYPQNNAHSEGTCCFLEELEHNVPETMKPILHVSQGLWI